jgi:hypothetical protein
VAEVASDLTTDNADVTDAGWLPGARASGPHVWNAGQRPVPREHSHGPARENREGVSRRLAGGSEFATFPTAFSPMKFRTTFCCALIAFAIAAAPALHAAKPGKVERREMKADGADAKPAKVSAEDAVSKALTKLREQFEVADDAEWEVIAGRIQQVTELRRTLTGSPSLRGGAVATDKVRRSTRGNEQDMLRTAVRDKLPDAEIKARLARAHEVRQQDEEKLAKAQEELRAILTVRQEAIAVVAGLLPP